MLKNKSVLLGITGGVAAYKAIDVIRRLREEGSSVTVIMTGAAKNFVTPLSLEVASQNRVYADLYSSPMAHITLPAQADIMLVAPATANIIGKFANGIADDLLSTIFLAYRGITVIAPSMNWRMYENPVLQKNLSALVSHGAIQVGPEKGGLACGEEGMGRMAEVSDIIEAVQIALTPKDLEKERILVTAGPTREYLDPVRFLSNRSSGKMGYAIAKAALRRGAEVALISGHSSLHRPRGMKFISVDTSEDMLNAVQSELPSATVLVMSAAVADYSPAEYVKNKIGKTKEILLRLRQTPDIVSSAGIEKNRPFIIGFAAETGWKIENARRKLKGKNMDMVVLNDVTEEGSGFDVDTNRVAIIDREQETELPLLSKISVANVILDRMISLKA
ncbi:MAG: bifunctional phosphopantothenoylcysteine decarboxylase/phosphopantothenate--cysteine ligase CoaBC [Nitrospirota bacterium]